MYYCKKKSEPKVTYTVTTDITTEVISLQEAKDFMQIDFNDFDNLIEKTFIPAARAEAEKYTGLSIGTRIIKLAGDFTDPDVYMPFMPITVPVDTQGNQTVGYTAATLPGDIKLALLNGIHVAFENRTTGLNYGSMLKMLEKSRRRVGL